VRNAVGQRYRYGASFVDQASGVRFEGHNPLERPDLWRKYLDGAEGVYRSYGFEETLRRREFEDGSGVPLFFLGFSPDGEAVAGVRFHGPLESSHQANLIEEMADSPDIDEIAALIDGEVRFGALESKGAWSKGEAVVGQRLAVALSRCFVHAMNWLGAEFAVAAVSDRLLAVGAVTGAVQVGASWVPFPDERYRTVAVALRRTLSYELSTESNQQALRREGEQLSRGPSLVGPGVVDGDSIMMRSRRPMVLDVTERSQREVLRVLREDPSLQILDRFEEQVTQLGEVRPSPSRSLLDEGQRWVYYPWRRALVRLLGPRAFSALRLDRNHNKLTRDEQARLRTLSIGVVGVSSGHSIAHVLAMEGLAGELRLADFDALELSNLNRVPASVVDLGVNKAVVAARRIAEIDPYLRVIVQPDGVTPDNLGLFLDGLDLVIEECDSLDMKFLVREGARKRGIPVIMETSDRGVLDVERFDLEPDRPLFHGLLGDMDSTRLAGLSTAQKSPFVIRLLGANDVSARGAASMFELGSTVTGWPQLASEVTLGAVTVAAAVRRFGLGGELHSGRVRFDVEEILSDIAPVDTSTEAQDQLNLPPPVDPPTESDDPIEFIVDAARRAPSGGNVQPWRFEADHDEIRFFVTPERSSSLMDVQLRGSYVAVGAALFNARVAAASIKKLGPVQLFPDGVNSDHVATLHLGNQVDAAIAQLQPSVPTRAANRRMGRPEPISETTIALLTRGVEREGATLRFATERDRIEEYARLLAESDRLRFLIPTVHQQMLSELRWPGRDSLEEGMDVRTLDMDPASMGALELLARPDVMAQLSDWRGGQALGLRTQAMVSSSSALALITVPKADPSWYVRGGAAIERFWLSAESEGLFAQPVSPLFLYAKNEQDLLNLGGERHLDEMYALSKRFHEAWDLAEGETMAMVLRVIHAVPPSVHSIRRPLSHVLTRNLDMVSSNGASVNGPLNAYKI
jgi:molybdopterin/thiamine biosynthesis adenylyltransferase/nitroreductase